MKNPDDTLKRNWFEILKILLIVLVIKYNSLQRQSWKNNSNSEVQI